MSERSTATAPPPRPKALSLWTRIVVAISILLAIGVALVGTGSVVLLERTLLEKVDQQLSSSISGIPGFDRYTKMQQPVANQGPRPSAFSLVWTPDAATGLPMILDSSTITDQNLGLLREQLNAHPVLKPFTIQLADGTEYRTISVETRTYNDTVTPSPLIKVRVTLLLPLDYTHDTINELTLWILAVGVLVVTVGTVVGGYATHRSLRPLREVEVAAADIAAGDLTRRVPETSSSLEASRLTDSLNEMMGQIEMAFADRTRSEERMRQFVADASHELRTPLAAIRGFGELYRMGALPDEVAVGSAMGRMEDEAKRMGSLVEDLLRLARLDEKPEPVNHEPVDLTRLASDASGDLRALDPARKVRVVPLEMGDSLKPYYALGDENMLRQVITNLMGNTARHTPDGSPVEFAVGLSMSTRQQSAAITGTTVGAARRVSQRVVAVLEVRDHGPGIDPEHARKVFERFFRTDSSRVRGTGGGAGLGLAIVDSIVQAHDGQVSVLPTPGGGATFRLELPAAQSAPAGTDAASD